MKKPLSLSQALSWILISIFLVSGSSYSLLKYYLSDQHKKKVDPKYRITSIVQTGPEREALNTAYLAELMGICFDNPPASNHFDIKKAKAHLLRSPVIKEAEVKILDASTLYVDYTVRKPIAWVYDYTNCAIDQEGVLFPVSPFLSPKKLPEIYLGLSEFKWYLPLTCPESALALDILKLLEQPAYCDFFNVRRIDVSKAYEQSYGRREIVLLTEDEIYQSQVTFVLPRILRLSTKNFPQELGNYLKLRRHLLEEEARSIKMPEDRLSFVRTSERVIDLRLTKIGFVTED